ncbi:phosphatidate cytidylyltransferase [Actinomyces vulturis]|uniref:phosphatidate cytidylyltransferase n=1 Tax=Actinomyces vulturis TaxID=1857645 RepID=UPI000832BAF6|nr:phosphatidate cytidylyltransferase [Actinomyces vulturis]
MWDTCGTILSPGPTPNRPPLPSTGKAGRNLPAALGVAAVLVGIVLATLMFTKVLFTGLVIIAVCGALWELAGAFARKGLRLPLAPLWLGTIGVVVCAWSVGAEAMFGAYLATAGAAFLWCFFDHCEAEAGTDWELASSSDIHDGAHDTLRRSRTSNAVAAVFAATYLPFLSGFAVLLLAQDHGVGKVLMLIALPVANDTGGWLAGITFGKHPMAPSVSPKKSWEGFAGSMIATILTATGCIWALNGPIWAGPILGACIVVVSTLGDLGESLIKRDVGLKDMGTLLPGHGGLMDRLDSILVAAPVVYLFCLLALC